MIRGAAPADAAAVRALLSSAGLPLAGLDATRLWVLDDGGVVGAVGLEVRGATALVRSLAVAPSRRGRGEGRLLLERALREAQAAGCREAVALTTTVAAWLDRSGWERTTREGLPPEAQASEELRGACPDTAAVFRRPLAGKPSTRPPIRSPP